MKVNPFLIVLAVLALIFSPITVAEEENTDYAVPAIADLPMLGPIQTNPHMLSASSLKEDINPFPAAEQIRWFDINRDLQINDFDVKQFQSIVENLHGEKLSGLQLSIRFRMAQKNQRDSFPIFYDLDRDGMFTPYDVDYFTQVINKLDEGRSRGTELIQHFKNVIPERFNRGSNF